MRRSSTTTGPAYLDRVHVQEAVRCSLADRHEPFVEALRDEAEQYWDAGDYKNLAAIQETLSRDSGGAHDYGTWVLALVAGGRRPVCNRSGTGRRREIPARRKRPILAHLVRIAWRNDSLKPSPPSIRTIALDGDDPTNICLRADVLLGLERFEAAIQDARAVLDMEPDHWHSFIQMINAAVGMNRPEDAEAYARDLVRIAPAEPQALIVAAEFYLSQDRLNQALEARR